MKEKFKKFTDVAPYIQLLVVGPSVGYLSTKIPEDEKLIKYACFLLAAIITLNGFSMMNLAKEIADLLKASKGTMSDEDFNALLRSIEQGSLAGTQKEDGESIPTESRLVESDEMLGEAYQV